VAPEKDMKEGRVAFLCPADYSYVATQWGIWVRHHHHRRLHQVHHHLRYIPHTLLLLLLQSAGGVAVPIGVHHPGPEVEYVISNSEASAVVIHPTYDARPRT
jgi:malonyl-CoA/methylmalonyl-CoA synthetase